jgi:DNA-binding SARP family transcriptional activator/Tfp pilus assembly protein PilF
MDSLELGILGPLQVWRDGLAVAVPATRQRDLLAALALQANRTVSTGRLVAVLWGDEPPATARNTLHTLVRRVRRLLAATPEQAVRVLETRPGGYLLRLEPGHLDADRFDTLLGRGRAALASGDPAAAVGALDPALGLWRGDPLADVSSEELLRVEQPRLVELRLQAREELIEARLRCGEHTALVPELRGLIAQRPLRERPYEQLMVALYRCGRPAEALETYQELRQVLAGQLGIEPGPSAQLLHRAVLRRDAVLDPQPPGAVRAGGEPPPVPSQLPAEVAGFTGRSAQLAALERLRTGGEDRTAIVAVVGTAGVGKTALALRWTHRLRDQFPDGQLFVDLKGFAPTEPLQPGDVLRRFLRAFGVPAAAVPADQQEVAARYRTLLADRKVLVLLDNARNADQVRPLLPGGRGCLTVITCRDRLDPLVAREGAARLRLEPLPSEESRALVAKVVEPGPDDDEAVAELAHLCAHLPLALRIAAANLAGRRTTVARYVERLRAGPLDPLELREDGPAAVRATFDLSYAVLGEAAQRLFRLFGCLPGLDLTAAAAAALADTDDRAAERLLDELSAAHLLWEVAPGRFGCHDLLCHYATRLAETVPAAEREAACGGLVAWYLAAAEAAVDLVHPDRLRLPAVDRLPVSGTKPPGFPGPPQALAWLDEERHNLVAVAGHAAAQGPLPAAWQLAGALRPYLSQRGHLPELLAISQASAGAAEAAGDLAGQAVAYLSLGTASWSRQRYPAAIDRYAHAARLADLAGWGEGAAAALANLATAHQHAGQRSEAAAYYDRALAGYERLGRRGGQAAILLNLGNTRWELGDLELAADHFTRALDHFRTTGSRTGQAVALHNLGNVSVERGQLEAALVYLTEALALNQEIGSQVSEAGTLRALAAAHCDAGRLAPAYELAGSALRLARQTRHQVYEAAALDTLATIHRRDGQPGPALQRLREALVVAARAGYPYLEAQVHLGLAETYRALERADLAASHGSQALAIARHHDYQRLEQQAATALDATRAGA